MNTGTVFIVFEFEVAAVMRDIECEFFRKNLFYVHGILKYGTCRRASFTSSTKAS